MSTCDIHAVPLATVLRLNAERTIPLDRYEEDGAFDRFGYLHGLAEHNGVKFDAVLTLVDVLGPDEDFDGLVAMIEDLVFIGA